MAENIFGSVGNDFNNFISGEGNKPGSLAGIDPNTFALISGNIGAAMGGKNNPMTPIGSQVASIAAGNKMAAVRNQNNAMFNSFLANLVGGQQFTPKGQAGPTEAKVNADGWVVSGDHGTPPVAGAPVDPATTRASGAAPVASLAPAPGYSSEAINPFLQALGR